MFLLLYYYPMFGISYIYLKIQRDSKTRQKFELFSCNIKYLPEVEPENVK